MINQLTAGTTLDFSTRVDQYPAPAWTLTYYLRGAATLDLVAAAVGTGFRVQASPAQTSGLNTTGTVAVYSWVARVFNATTGETYEVGGGRLQVLPNIQNQAAGYDGRLQAERDLAAIDAEISARASGGATVEYSIGSRHLKKEPIAALLALRTALRLEITQLRRAQAIASGLGDPQKLFVRFR